MIGELRESHWIAGLTTHLKHCVVGETDLLKQRHEVTQSHGFAKLGQTLTHNETVHVFTDRHVSEDDLRREIAGGRGTLLDEVNVQRV